MEGEPQTKEKVQPHNAKRSKDTTLPSEPPEEGRRKTSLLPLTFNPVTLIPELEENIFV
jgi:hypothetical protein